VDGQHELFEFLTTDANAEVGAVHPKAMPVILTAEAKIERWMIAPAQDALKLQRPLTDGTLKIVATGQKEGSYTLISENTPAHFPLSGVRQQLQPRSRRPV
jgi:putative SOS response-associated peptidase YedK